MTRKQMLLYLVIFLFTTMFGWMTLRFYDIKSRLLHKPLASMKELISSISDVIIPKTDTPGAAEAGVADYIVKVGSTCISDRERIGLIKGLEILEKYSYQTYSSSFTDCSDSQKIEILSYFEKKSTYGVIIFDKVYRKLWGRPFFSIIKELTVFGYCRSKLGATKGLSYDHIPVDFLSCIPLKNRQKSWATK